jgi:hypothetical protein
MVFELFEREGTAYSTVRRFQELGLRFPRRSYGGAWDGKLVWGRLTHSRVLGVLANLRYAGAYVFGRYKSQKQVGPSGDIVTRLRPVAQNEWRVLIRDHHEGYINWDRFVSNRDRLSANRTNDECLAGPAREGLCLLQGMLHCGECGHRLGIRYKGNGGIYPTYECTWKHREGLASRACINVSALPLDKAVSDRMISVITPRTIELALAALMMVRTDRIDGNQRYSWTKNQRSWFVIRTRPRSLRRKTVN